MAAWVIPVALGAASAIGSIASAVDANKTNKQIARETNQANLDLYREQFVNTKELNDINNAWNSPQNQVSMLRQAGLNPALSYGDGASSQMPALPSAPLMQGYRYESPLKDAFGTAISSIGEVMQASKDDETAKGLAIDNQTKSAENQYNLNLLREAIKAKQQEYQRNTAEWSYYQKQIEDIDLRLSRERDTYDFDVQNRALQNDLLRSQMKNAEREQNRQDALALLEKRKVESNIKYNDKQIENLSVAIEILKDENMLKWDSHIQEQELRRLDAVLKNLDIDRQQQLIMFEGMMQDSELVHMHLKDSSLLNRLAEVCFGIGLRDLGQTFRALAAGAASVVK